MNQEPFLPWGWGDGTADGFRMAAEDPITMTGDQLTSRRARRSNRQVFGRERAGPGLPVDASMAGYDPPEPMAARDTAPYNPHDPLPERPAGAVNRNAKPGGSAAT